MKSDLIQYRTLVQFLNISNDSDDVLKSNLITDEHVYVNVKKARKNIKKLLSQLRRKNLRIITAKIEPVLLEEDFLEGE
jgi:hypothetical protein